MSMKFSSVKEAAMKSISNVLTSIDDWSRLNISTNMSDNGEIYEDTVKESKKVARSSIMDR